MLRHMAIISAMHLRRGRGESDSISWEVMRVVMQGHHCDIDNNSKRRSTRFRALLFPVRHAIPDIKLYLNGHKASQRFLPAYPDKC
jgi:hypothetical protein